LNGLDSSIFGRRDVSDLDELDTAFLAVRNKGSRDDVDLDEDLEEDLDIDLDDDFESDLDEDDASDSDFEDE